MALHTQKMGVPSKESFFFGLTDEEVPFSVSAISTDRLICFSSSASMMIATFKRYHK